MLIKDFALKVVALKTEPSPLTQHRKAVFEGAAESLRCTLGLARNTVGFLSLRHVLLLAVASVLLGASASEAGLKIYYIRHAEGGHNVKKNWETYSDIPKDQWPAYVGDPDVFTPMGQGQLARVPGKLKRYRFDFIAASSMWRARKTILSYMKEVGAKGEFKLKMYNDVPVENAKIVSAQELRTGSVFSVQATVVDNLTTTRKGQ